MKKLLLALLLCPSLAFAAPLKIPALKLCLNPNTGAIAAKQRCAKTETVATANTLRSTIAPASNALSRCRPTTKDCSISIFGYCELTCSTGEYLLTHAAMSDGNSNLAIGNFPASSYTDTGLFFAIRYYFEVPFDAAQFDPDSNVRVYGTCCPLN